MGLFIALSMGKRRYYHVSLELIFYICVLEYSILMRFESIFQIRLYQRLDKIEF